MRVGLFTDGLGHLSLGEVVEWCDTREIYELELGVGGYSRAPHVDAGLLLEDAEARRAFVSSLGPCRVSALNASGNPLHPEDARAAAHDAAVRAAVRLAALLEVPRVVAMSGCPGAPGGGTWPVFAGGAWLPDMEGLWEWQWRERLEPYWRELSEWAAREAPTVRICLELHPGTSIYNPASFRQLETVTAGNVGINLDPSHFWWQGIDPVQAVGELGDAIGLAHGKDTLIRSERVARDGLLDFGWPHRAPEELPWHFVSVGSGHADEDWARFVDALRSVGYDDVISIEHEDPLVSPDEGIEASIAALRRVATVRAWT